MSVSPHHSLRGIGVSSMTSPAKIVRTSPLFNFSLRAPESESSPINCPATVFGPLQPHRDVFVQVQGFGLPILENLCPCTGVEVETAHRLGPRVDQPQHHWFCWPVVAKPAQVARDIVRAIKHGCAFQCSGPYPAPAPAARSAKMRVSSNRPATFPPLTKASLGHFSRTLSAGNPQTSVSVCASTKPAT